MIRVMLPPHLQSLARVEGEVALEVEGLITLDAVVDRLESEYPMLRGTIVDHDSRERRPFIRFIACQTDFSHVSPTRPLPEAVATGIEPLLIIGAIAGG